MDVREKVAAALHWQWAIEGDAELAERWREEADAVLGKSEDDVAKTLCQRNGDCFDRPCWDDIGKCNHYEEFRKSAQAALAAQSPE